MQLHVGLCVFYFQVYVYSMSKCLLTEQEGTPRNASLVKERVKLVPMKKGKVSSVYMVFFVLILPCFRELRVNETPVFWSFSEVKVSKEKVKAVSAKTGTAHFKYFKHIQDIRGFCFAC